MPKNAKFYRNALRGLVAALALGGLQVAHAGYAQLSPPAGFSTSSGGFTYAAAANDRVYGKVIHQAGALTANVGGQAVKMPAAYRLAANAPRIAAAAIYLHPGIRTAVGIAAWLATAKVVWDSVNGVWRQEKSLTESGGAGEWNFYNSGLVTNNPNEYCAKTAGWTFEIWSPTDGSCRNIATGAWGESARRQPTQQPEQCPVGWTPTPAGCLSPALTQPQFEDALNPHPMPEKVPLELPGNTPLPVEQPYINPEPGENPVNRPLRVPTGEPQPIPNTNPQQWRQPYVDIVPAPTPESPWRVDVKPGEVTSTDPNPVQNPKPDAEEKPTEEQDKSLCEKHPDILACQKPDLDTPDGEIPRTSKTVTYAEEGGFGGGSCPGNIYSNVGGKSIMVYNWSETCGVVSTYLRPIILLLGAMGSLFILIPGRDS